MFRTLKFIGLRDSFFVCIGNTGSVTFSKSAKSVILFILRLAPLSVTMIHSTSQKIPVVGSPLRSLSSALDPINKVRGNSKFECCYLRHDPSDSTSPFNIMDGFWWGWLGGDYSVRSPSDFLELGCQGSEPRPSLYAALLLTWLRAKSLRMASPDLSGSLNISLLLDISIGVPRGVVFDQRVALKQFISWFLWCLWFLQFPRNTGICSTLKGLSNLHLVVSMGLVVSSVKKRTTPFLFGRESMREKERKKERKKERETDRQAGRQAD